MLAHNKKHWSTTNVCGIQKVDKIYVVNKFLEFSKLKEVWCY